MFKIMSDTHLGCKIWLIGTCCVWATAIGWVMYQKTKFHQQLYQFQQRAATAPITSQTMFQKKIDAGVASHRLLSQSLSLLQKVEQTLPSQVRITTFSFDHKKGITLDLESTLPEQLFQMTTFCKKEFNAKLSFIKTSRQLCTAQLVFNN